MKMSTERISYEANDAINRFLIFKSGKLELYAEFKDYRHSPGLQRLFFMNESGLPVSITTNINQLHMLHDALGDILAEHEAFKSDANGK
jgi:hypothetical protein